jgi:hypothetical protein
VVDAGRSLASVADCRNSLELKALFAKPWWPQIRAALILVHVLAITAGSIPVIVDKRAMTEEAWQDPIAQEEFERWSERMQGWGIDASPEDVEKSAWAVAAGILEFQTAVQAPFLPYYEFFGSRQRWRMFPAPVKNPVRLRIDVETGGEWVTVYRMGSREEKWLAHFFNRDRFRAALNLYAWNVYPEAYEEFVDWAAAQAAIDFPAGARVRIGFEVLPVTEREEAAKGGARAPEPMERAKGLRVVELEPARRK